MKKIIITIVLGFTALFATSCQNIYEKTYEAEMLYKAKKEAPESVRGSLEGHKARFLNMYKALDNQERRVYKDYRSQWNKEAKAEAEAMKRAEFEAIEMLNN